MNNKSIVQIIGGAAVTATAVGAYIFAIRPWHLRWGATDEEVNQPLPGDELAPPHPELNATHSITINAPVEDVWHWLVQIGQTRGGFYSYTWLENLVGCHMKNADKIIPEWQSLTVGDQVFLHPQAPPLPVTAISPNHSLVLANIWAFTLKEIDQTTTRLIVRGQGNFSPDFGKLGNFFYWRVLFEPAHFIMERKMMVGIKQRAESAFKLRKNNVELKAALQ